ncbi:MAG: hypothetical protein ACOCP8_00190 [archaeon]
MKRLIKKSKYYNTVEDHFGDIVEIFVNPTINDITDVKNSSGIFDTNQIKFLIDQDSKQIYIWSGTKVYHHIELINKLGLNGNTSNIFNGAVEFNGGKFLLNSTNCLGYDNEKLLNGDYDWIEQYYFDLNELKNSQGDINEKTN